jgi:hypothetical protein
MGESKTSNRLKDFLWPIGGALLGLLVVPILIEQYPEIFKESPWILPLSTGVMILCFVFPLLFHERVTRGFRWSREFFGMPVTVLALVIIVGALFLVGGGIYRWHVHHLESRLGKNTQEPVTHVSSGDAAQSSQQPQSDFGNLLKEFERKLLRDMAKNKPSTTLQPPAPTPNPVAPPAPQGNPTPSIGEALSKSSQDASRLDQDWRNGIQSSFMGLGGRNGMSPEAKVEFARRLQRVDSDVDAEWGHFKPEFQAVHRRVIACLNGPQEKQMTPLEIRDDAVQFNQMLDHVEHGPSVDEMVESFSTHTDRFQSLVDYFRELGTTLRNPDLCK